MTPWLLRRLQQAGIGLALAAAVILVTEWAYPAGQLSIQVGAPHYSRMVADTAPDVTVDLVITNVGIKPVLVDGQRFLLEDDEGYRYRGNPSAHLIAEHYDDVMLPLAQTVHATRVYTIRPGRKATWLVFVTPTGQAVRFRLR